MDNFHIDITSVGDTALRYALGALLATKYARMETIVGWKDDPEKGLILYKHKSDAMTPFLAALDLDALVPIISTWLAQQDYGREPDHDGSNSKGFRLYNEVWGRIGDDWASIGAIKPEWAWHGK